MSAAPFAVDIPHVAPPVQTGERSAPAAQLQRSAFNRPRIGPMPVERDEPARAVLHQARQNLEYNLIEQLRPQRNRSREFRLTVALAVAPGGQDQHARIHRFDSIRNVFRRDHIRAQRQVPAMLLGGSDRKNHHRILRQNPFRLRPGQICKAHTQTSPSAAAQPSGR